MQATSCTDPNGHPNTCLFHIRTNEFELHDENLQNGNFWEQREFYIQTYGPPNVIAEKDVAQTPDGSFNTAGELNPGGQPDCQGNFTIVNGVLTPPSCSPLSPATLATYISAFNPEIVETQGTLQVPDDFPSGHAVPWRFGIQWLQQYCPLPTGFGMPPESARMRPPREGSFP